MTRILYGKKYEHEREEDDFYSTPEFVTRILLRRINLNGRRRVFEPFIGDGAIARVIENQTINAVICGSDIKDRNSGYDCVIQDIFSKDYTMPYPKPDFVVSNPPYPSGNKTVKIMQKCYDMAADDGIIALLYPTDYVSGKTRGAFFQEKPPAKIIFIPKKIDFLGKGNPMKTFAWYVWDKSAPFNRISKCEFAKWEECQ